MVEEGLSCSLCQELSEFQTEDEKFHHEKWLVLQMEDTACVHTLEQTNKSPMAKTEVIWQTGQNDWEVQVCWGQSGEALLWFGV